MSSSKASAKHFIVPQDLFYCIDFFAKPKPRLPTSSTNYAAPNLKLTMDAVSAVETERRTEDTVLRWLDALPDRFSRIPGDSRSKVRALQLEKLEKERDLAYRMLLAQQSQPQFNNTERTPVLNFGVEEYLSLIEPDRQRFLEELASETKEVKGERHKRDTKEHPNVLPAEIFQKTQNDPQSREHVETKEPFPATADLSPAYGPPPIIPQRSMLRPSVATFSETAPGTIQTIQHAEAINASSSQYSSVVDILPKEATANGTSGVVKDLESGIRRDNPGLVAELRLGMERRRQRERARDDDDLEKECAQGIGKGKVWALKLWK
ncbi:hypothetical protein VC83_06302 [Pseudogymnoascus destructans]|uniref:Uncharacterized protein n=2 Tax=Pseudogymnoascus destructans TaxID=655981 RepID=L8FN20_PSED2|nr:uncharacterized protein VC83_06302 [Pseudogymnoascus destructans]ELR01873.1 hypothetical protein GMDG_05060 [Pseudogymnoascus destructans 20631-21]OAF59014.1 hypothetical protein VC83_06302 [Pseudogymnoascus destructans]